MENWEDFPLIEKKIVCRKKVAVKNKFCEKIKKRFFFFLLCMHRSNCVTVWNMCFENFPMLRDFPLIFISVYKNSTCLRWKKISVFNFFLRFRRDSWSWAFMKTTNIFLHLNVTFFLFEVLDIRIEKLFLPINSKIFYCWRTRNWNLTVFCF